MQLDIWMGELPIKPFALISKLGRRGEGGAERGGREMPMPICPEIAGD